MTALAWRAADAGRWRTASLPWVIALATGLEYFDNTAFSFFITQLAGGVNAAPDELIWSSSAYALASVLGILGQHWWVERIGYRRYLAACLALFAAGAVAAALSDNSIDLALARGFQGYFIGPMMGACRILLQVEFTPARRPAGVRAFLQMSLLASALAPLAGGYLIAAFDWRSLFACMALAGLALALLVLSTVPHSGHVEREARGESHVWPYIVFALAQGALQVVMQQVRFELFSSSPELLLLAGAGVLALAWFAWHQWHQPKPLMRLHALREKAFQAGIVLYVFFYFISNVLGYLSSRLLEGALGYPVESAGRLVGLTSLASLGMVFVYFRYSARITRKKWLIIPGFALAGLIGAWLARITPEVDGAWLVPPLVLRGLLLLFIAMPVAGVTFRLFAADEFHHGYRFKNIVKQLTNSSATAIIITLEQHRFAVHYTRLAENFGPFNPAWQRMVETFGTLGTNTGQARTLALAELNRLATQQANFLSLIDGFYLVAGLALCGGVFAFWQRQID